MSEPIFLGMADDKDAKGKRDDARVRAILMRDAKGDTQKTDPDALRKIQESIKDREDRQ